MVSGAREAGMGNVCSTSGTFWSSFRNPAGITFIKHFSAGVNYEDRFNIKELGRSSAALIIPYGNANIGGLYSNSGYSDLKRHMASLACGLTFSERFSAGVQVGYQSLHTWGEYENTENLTFSTGIILSPGEKVRVGISIFNPWPGVFKKSDIPASITAGAGIFLADGVFASAETELSTSKEMLLRTGFEFAAAKNFQFRGGFVSENNSFCFGIGYVLNIMHLDLAFVSHDKLGLTSSASFVFNIK